MPEEFKPGCARPKSGPPADAAPPPVSDVPERKVKQSMIRVGQKAPDFTAAAFHKGKFVEVKLSEYIGKWVVLCFYPGDFTFV